jgi:hypothetical protein
VLFSRADVAATINRYFEPAWESVRPVPIVRIDFGGGRVLTRTLQGNIATSVCTEEGDVLDILPGIYTSGAFLTQLYQFRLLANYADQDGKACRAARMKEYHRLQAERLRQNKPPAQFVNAAPITKAAIENRLKAVLALEPMPVDRPVLESTGDPATQKLLEQDTLVNETIRRLQIHDLLTKNRLSKPAVVVKPLYREVLHADLDDPYLGLGGVLFAGYPFKDR